jgi:putative redox protein
MGSIPNKNLVTATLGRQDFYTHVVTAFHDYYVDEPEQSGGGNKAPHPTAYLLGALASCSAITIRMYARRKNWDAGEIKIEAEKVETIADNGEKTVRIVKKITFGNKLPEDQKRRLVSIAEKCPVSRLLKNETEIISELVE